MSRARRLTCIALLGFGACGGSVDDRPRTLEYITKAVLAPNCASAECHSTFSQEGRHQGDGTVIPLVFDTVKGARSSFARDSLLVDHFEKDAEQTPTLILNLTVETDDAPRMPFDRPLPDEDIELIRDWIKLGGPGICTGEPDPKLKLPFPAFCHYRTVYNCNEEQALTTPVFPPQACKYQ